MNIINLSSPTSNYSDLFINADCIQYFIPRYTGSTIFFNNGTDRLLVQESPEEIMLHMQQANGDA